MGISGIAVESQFARHLQLPRGISRVTFAACISNSFQNIEDEMKRRCHAEESNGHPSEDVPNM